MHELNKTDNNKRFISCQTKRKKEITINLNKLTNYKKIVTLREMWFILFQFFSYFFKTQKKIFMSSMYIQQQNKPSPVFWRPRFNQIPSLNNPYEPPLQLHPYNFTSIEINFSNQTRNHLCKDNFQIFNLILSNHKIKIASSRNWRWVI